MPCVEHENNQRDADDHSKSKTDAGDCIKKQADDFYKKDEDNSSMGKSLSTEELSHSLDIADESALDSEVGKRLNVMVPVAVRIISVNLYHTES